MGLLQAFDPPAFLSDFDGIPGLREAWHRFIWECFETSIASEKPSVRSKGGGLGAVQFYNPSTYDSGGALIEQPIIWNAFPKELLRQFGREEALRQADKLWPLPAYRNYTERGTPGFDSAVYRPLTEYCEWHVLRDPDTNKIQRVTFTSEPPEYWTALAGDSIAVGDQMVAFPGNKDKLLALYQELVSEQIEMEDLLCQEDITTTDGQFTFKKGQYNPYNKWNTTHGIAHLCAPPNSIMAEIQLGADATVLRRNAANAPIVEPEALICCAGYGGPDRNSDPTIGATVNALARLGAMITLPNPVGLYMDHSDLSGWEAPEGIKVADCVKIVRGAPGMIERMVVEAPADSGAVLGDFKIGGVVIEYGGQIAECITVKLVGAAAQLDSVHNVPVACTNKCCLDPNHAVSLDRNIPISATVPPGMRVAFIDEGAVDSHAISATRRGRAPRAARARAKAEA